jgi:uncharacterized protein
MRTSKAEVATANAVNYRNQLCRHWAHRFPVEFNEEEGTIELPQARCVLKAGPAALAVTVEVQEGADQDRTEKVVEEHLQRFGFRETLVFEWTRG